jgi:hypothetical protein
MHPAVLGAVYKHPKTHNKFKGIFAPKLPTANPVN